MILRGLWKSGSPGNFHHLHLLTPFIPRVSQAWRVWKRIPQWFWFTHTFMAQRTWKSCTLPFYDILLKFTSLYTLMKFFSWQFTCISLLHLTSVIYDYYLTYHINNFQTASQVSSIRNRHLLLNQICYSSRGKARVLTMENKIPRGICSPPGYLSKPPAAPLATQL